MQKSILKLGLLLVASLLACNKNEITKPATTANQKTNALKMTANDSLKVGLIAYYPFTNNATDSSGRHHNGTVVNALLTSDRFGMANSAYAFNGKSSYISVKDSSDLRLNNTDFTLNMWVNMDAYKWVNLPAYGNALLIKRQHTGNLTGWGASIQNGAPFFNVAGPQITKSVSKSKITSAMWHMVTITYSLKQQQVSFYIDGILKSAGTGIITPDALNNSQLYIGHNDQSTSDYFKGSIDDIRVYNRKLSTNEMLSLFGKIN